MTAAQAIHVGYEVGTGEPVAIPIGHIAVTGQTQASGKTTTLEALVARAGVTALAFVTKRGESAFAEGRRVQAYFRDRADWGFVTSLIDATLQEKNKFLRPWIMKICRTTRTLADVQREVRKALVKAKGINEGVYTQLDAYLDLIVPEIQRADLAPTLELTSGLNVMDVSSFATPMQMLFIQSAIDWVNEHASETVVIVPEAWEMIPEGKGSPVKSSAVSLVRKGAAIGNYIWVDSQDMAGVDKVILRGCAVWLIGVQREANEIKRNLANIPKSIKRPSAAAVAMLERGQFYVCWGQHAVKTYVQPKWLTEHGAREVSLGGPPPVSPRRPQISEHPSCTCGKDIVCRVHGFTKPNKEKPVNESEARELREENERLLRRVEELERKLSERDEGARTVNRTPRAASSNDKAERDAAPSGYQRTGDAGSTPVAATSSHSGNGIDEALYQSIKRRLLSEQDPGVLRLLTQRPELRVEVDRPVIDAKGDTLKGRIARLIADGFFRDGATAPGTQKELGRRGFDPGPANLYKELDGLALLGFLTIEQGRDERSRPRKEYKAVPGMQVNIVER